MTENWSFPRRPSNSQSGSSRSVQRSALGIRVLLASACIATTLLPSTSLVGAPLHAGAAKAPVRIVAANTAVTVPASDSMVASLLDQAPGLRESVLRLALDASNRATNEGLVKRSKLLTVIDYSIPSTQPRLFVFNLEAKRLLFRELVAHGKNSGENLAKRFSNLPASLETSLGLFVTGKAYYGSNGYSLQLVGLEKGVNDLALERAIVMHGAAYVNEATARALGRIGRSWGCPAVRMKVASKIIDTIKGGSPIFAYYPDSKWLSNSSFLTSSAGGLPNS